jgi:hypothetical protein
MSFSNPYVCKNTKFWELNIDPLSNYIPGKLSIASGRVANIADSSSKYDIFATPYINNDPNDNDGGLYIKNGNNGNILLELIENPPGYTGTALGLFDSNGNDNGYITGIKDPINPSDVATKNYVDNHEISYPCTKLYDNEIDGAQGPPPTAVQTGNGNNYFSNVFPFTVVPGGIYRVTFTGYVESNADHEGVGMGVGVLLNNGGLVKTLCAGNESSTVPVNGSYCIVFTVPSNATAGRIVVFVNGNGGTATGTLQYAYVQRLS